MSKSLGVLICCSRQYWQLLSPYLFSEQKRRIWQQLLWLAGLITLVLTTQILLNRWQKTFYDALQQFHWATLIKASGEFIALLGVLILATGQKEFSLKRFALGWQEHLTQTFLKHWLSQTPPQAHRVENPDQRISEDIGRLTRESVMLLSELFINLLQMISFGVVLFHLAGPLTLPLGGVHSITLPAMAFWLTFIYLGLGIFTMAWLGKSLPARQYQDERLQANFRYGLIKKRQQLAAIQLQEGTHYSQQTLLQQFYSYCQNRLGLYRLERRLRFFNTGYSRFTFLAGVLFALLQNNPEQLALGSIMQIASAIYTLEAALTVVLFEYPKLTALSVDLKRLHELLLGGPMSTEPQITLQQHNKTSIQIRAISLPRLKHFSLDIATGEWVLLHAPKHGSKTALFQALAGLPVTGQGQLLVPDTPAFTLPHHPHLPSGTLQEALCYPFDKTAFSHEQRCEVLHSALCSDLIPLLETTQEWQQWLSLPRLQQLGFVRLLLHKPQWALLDDCTCAIPPPLLEHLLSTVRQTLPKLTLISFSQTTHAHNHFDSCIALQLHALPKDKSTIKLSPLG